jgi:transcriptional regulator with XRE-family HTH domain
VSKYYLPAEEIRRIRRKLGETQAQFANRLDVDAVSVARWETGQRKCTGLYAKTIKELDQGSLLLINEESEMKPNNQESLLRTVGLDKVCKFQKELEPLLLFLYKEVPLEKRGIILDEYHKFFEFYAPQSGLFDEICSTQLMLCIGNFVRALIEEPIDLVKPTDYQNEKLIDSHESIYEIAKELAPNSDSAKEEASRLTEEKLAAWKRIDSIQSVVADLLSQTGLEKGDFALLEFFQSLLKFIKYEMAHKKVSPIRIGVSVAFGKVLSLGLTGITMLVPKIDDYSELESLQEAVKFRSPVAQALAKPLENQPST